MILKEMILLAHQSTTLHTTLAPAMFIDCINLFCVSYIYLVSIKPEYAFRESRTQQYYSNITAILDVVPWTAVICRTIPIAAQLWPLPIRAVADAQRAHAETFAVNASNPRRRHNL